MFTSKVYTDRRIALRKLMKDGVALIPANMEAAYNYPQNTYTFRQDSNFSYFFGLENPGFFGIIDIDNDKDYLFGNDFDMDDIIWMGPQPKVTELAASVGVANTGTMSELETFIKNCIKNGRKLHFTMPYRGHSILQMSQLTGIRPNALSNYVSLPLIKAIVSLRSIKSDIEIVEIEKAMDIAYDMFTTAMRMTRPGIKEQEIVGAMEGISIANGRPVSFPIICSVNGQTLHNHYHGNILKDGQLLLIDAGCETSLNYASDNTRTFPVSGVFSQKQKEIYEIVLKSQEDSIKATQPGVTYKECHFVACKTIAQGLIDLGLMKGNADEAVAAGAHALFLPHGLGHMLGMDVHDMEGLGQVYVGFDETIQPSTQFGLASLRLGRELKPGFVVTNEPGIYFIPELISKWKSEKMFTQFINYNKVDDYVNFGGIRIEDDILVTENGHRILGKKPIPKTVKDVEAIMKR